MSKTLKNIGYKVGFLILVFCALILAASVQGMAASGTSQAIQPLSGSPIITQTDPLFMLDGTSNAELINQLVYLSENADRGAPNLHSGHVGVSGIEVSDARHIREFNGGLLPDILLFESHGILSQDGMPSNGILNNQSRDNFTHSRWRLVYITHPDDGSDPVFTFRMVEAFRNNRMHVVSTDWSNSVRYENSDLRHNLIAEFDNVLNLFQNSSYLRSHFVAPIDLPGAWQSNQPDIGTPINQSMAGDALNDLIWLPSAYEVAGSGGQDLWRLTREERSHYGSRWAWLRSGQSTHPDRARIIEGVGTPMANDSDPVTNTQAVVPALHLSFSNYASITADFSDESSRAATVQAGQESPGSQTRFSIERYEGEHTVVFNANEFNTVQNLTVRYGLNSITLTPTDTPTEFVESLGTFEIWYSNDRRIVHVNISNVNQTFSLTAHTTNNWEVTRIYGWPTGFGLSASPPNSTVIAENSFTNAIDAPVASPNGHHFYGWWTNNGASGNWGTLVNTSTTVANVGNLETVEYIETMYARWMTNTATVERVHYGNSIENLGVQVVWFAGVVMEPELSNHLPADENLVFGGWWSQDGTGGYWGQRVTANTFITEAQNGTTIQIFARWQLYVPRSVLDEFDLSKRRISWESSISGASFVVSVNGETYEDQTEDYFDFAHFTQGTHTISVRTVSAGYESDALLVTIVIPHTPTFTEVWTGYDDNEPRPLIGDTRTDGGYEYELVRWDSVLTTAANGDKALTHTAVWERVEHTPTFAEVWTGYDDNEPRPVIGDIRTDGGYEYELVRWDSILTTAANGDKALTHTAVWVRLEHTPTFTEVWTGYDDNEPRPVIGDTRTDGGYEYELVRWDSILTTAANGDRALTHTAVWVRAEATRPTEVVIVHFVDSRVAGGFDTDTRTVVDLERDIVSPDWTREGYLLSWEATIEDGIMTFMAVWIPQNQGGYELGNFEMNVVSWILLGSSTSLAIAFVVVSILAIKRKRKINS